MDQNPRLMERLREFIFDFYARYKNHVPLLILFLFGSLLIHYGVKDYKKSMGLDQPLVKVLVSNESLFEGQKLQIHQVRVIQMPQKYIPSGAVRAGEFSKISGIAIKRQVAKDELLLWSVLDLDYNYQSPSSKIERGYRAVSIPMDQLSSISGMIRPGDHIDLMTTIEIPGESKPSTMTLLQNVSVLSVGDFTSNTETNIGGSTLSLMVLPSEANLIMHSAKYGNLSLSLRNPLDLKTDAGYGIISDQEIVQSAFRNQIQNIRNLSSPLNSR